MSDSEFQLSADGPATTSRAGAARLAIVLPGVAVSVFFGVVLEYCLPLYFGALDEAAKRHGGSFPKNAWSELWKYQQTVWIVGPLLAGIFSRRYGEKLVWGAALIVQGVIPLLLMADLKEKALPYLSLAMGATGSLTWIAGVSLVQAVAPDKKGLANGLTMVSLGLGSLLGPVIGRTVLYRAELSEVIARDGWLAAAARFFNLAPLQSRPEVSDFSMIFWLLAAVSLLSGVVVGLWGQRRPPDQKTAVPDWASTGNDLSQLARSHTFWSLVLSLCVLGGPVFAMANQFLPYRAEQLGLKSGAEDHGWIWMQLLKPIMWIPGGAAVGLLAGRRAPGIAGVIMLGVFSLASLAIGTSSVAWQLFAAVALFEFVRQFMRWSHAGYLTEHLPADLRATAIGASVTFAGLAGTIASWGASLLWNPDAPGFESSRPFVIAAMVGFSGSILLLVMDRLRPIREQREGAALNTDGSPVLEGLPG